MSDHRATQAPPRTDLAAAEPKGTVTAEPGGPGRSAPSERPRRPLWVWAIRYSGLLGIALLSLIFSISLPDLFPTETTVRTVVANQAITGILALGVMLPLIAGMIDLSFGAIAGLSLVLTVWMSIHTDLPVSIIAVVAIATAALCGMISGLLVAFVRLESFIVTLGMSSLVLGLTEMLTDGTTLFGEFDPGFVDLGQGGWGPIPYLTAVLIGLSAITWIWLEHTPSGRYTLAVGSNPEASRLAGIRVERTQFVMLTLSAAVAGVAGVLLAAQVGNGSTTVGPGYLLPVIAVLFLGATQVKDRPNVVGAIIALFLLGIGIKGLQLAGADIWTTNVFNGGVLLFAITVAAVRSRQSAAGH